MSVSKAIKDLVARVKKRSSKTLTKQEYNVIRTASSTLKKSEYDYNKDAASKIYEKIIKGGDVDKIEINYRDFVIVKRANEKAKKKEEEEKAKREASNDPITITPRQRIRDLMRKLRENPNRAVVIVVPINHPNPAEYVKRLVRWLGLTSRNVQVEFGPADFKLERAKEKIAKKIEHIKAVKQIEKVAEQAQEGIKKPGAPVSPAPALFGADFLTSINLMPFKEVMTERSRTVPARYDYTQYTYSAPIKQDTATIEPIEYHDDTLMQTLNYLQDSHIESVACADGMTIADMGEAYAGVGPWVKTCCAKMQGEPSPLEKVMLAHELAAETPKGEVQQDFSIGAAIEYVDKHPNVDEQIQNVGKAAVMEAACKEMGIETKVVDETFEINNAEVTTQSVEYSLNDPKYDVVGTYRAIPVLDSVAPGEEYAPNAVDEPVNSLPISDDDKIRAQTTVNLAINPTWTYTQAQELATTQISEAALDSQMTYTPQKTPTYFN